MLHFKKILVPFDGSDHAKKALTQAIDLVQNSEDAELCILAINEDVTAVAVNNLERVYINPQPTLSKYDPANDYITMAKKNDSRRNQSQLCSKNRRCRYSHRRHGKP